VLPPADSQKMMLADSIPYFHDAPLHDERIPQLAHFAAARVWDRPRSPSAHEKPPLRQGLQKDPPIPQLNYSFDKSAFFHGLAMSLRYSHVPRVLPAHA